jgi:hypothetical protein
VNALKNLFNILFLLALAYQAFPPAITLNSKEVTPSDRWMGILILALMQAVLYNFGGWLGRRFMYLFEAHSSIIVFAVLAFISLRLIQQALKIRKGAILFDFNTLQHFTLLAIMIAFPAFFAGLIQPWFSPFGWYFSWSLMGVSFLFALLSAKMKSNPYQILMESLFQLLAASFVIFNAFYVLFSA